LSADRKPATTLTAEFTIEEASPIRNSDFQPLGVLVGVSVPCPWIKSTPPRPTITSSPAADVRGYFVWSLLGQL
jgi:hypothetical protein